LRDAAALAAVVPELLALAPLRESALPASAAARKAQAQVVGTLPAYQAAARLQVASGRFLTPLDVEDAARVVVLGALLAQELFPLGEARGERVLLGGDYFQVVGVLEGRASRHAKGGTIRSRDINHCAFVPLPALDRGGDSRPDGVDEIVLRLRDASRVVGSAEVVRAVLRRTTGADGFEIVVPQEILRQKERTQRIFNVVTGAIAAISLLVGGIGIMNIMLASVAERTREVGIRRAVGASRRNILAQFLIEACLLTGAGGVLGGVLGIGFSELIQRLAGWPTALSGAMLLLSLLTALSTGVGFGLYPAWRAAQLEPMEALRHA
jgi:putative ABC transport system permease protein